MVSKLDQYLAAATRENTRRSYAAATRHFEVEWGGCLPASPETVARYLADYGDRLAANTLRQRLAALGSWHTAHGFVDPTRAPIVRQAMRGIQTLHPKAEKRATPLQLCELGQVADWLEHAAAAAGDHGDRTSALRYLRDRAMILLGFWRGFRSDELIHLRAEHVEFIGQEGMHCFLGHSKGDRSARGALYKVPALSRWCAVSATREWLAQAGISNGPVFRKIDRTGRLGEHALHPNSIVPLLRSAFARAGLSADEYSSHSLRRGFAGWANANGWDVKSLMEYVGWRDVQSAMRYVDARDPFRAIADAGAPAVLVLAAPEKPAAPPAVLVLDLHLHPRRESSRDRAKALRIIEKSYLGAYRAQRLDAAGTRFQLEMHGLSELELEESIATLIDAVHRIAANHECTAEVSLSDSATGRHWD